MTRAPSLAEQWFIEDTIEQMTGLCQSCRDDLGNWLRLFGRDDRTALHEIYVQSRAIRVTQSRDCDNWEALRVMQFIGGCVDMASAGLRGVRPR